MYLVNLSQDQSSHNTYISNTLLKEMEETLKENKKIILYLNRRWEFSSLICQNCQLLYKCENCDVSLNVHKYPAKLLCHICSFEKNIPSKCEKCGQKSLKNVWIWTQQIEYFLLWYFPKTVKIFRFDTDVIKNKSDKKLALENLQNADIIIWTKMITTWFDFRNIWLIWTILLEQELQIPAYNTKEKVYSNIKQLIGRWSRNGETTKVIIQTFIPKNEIITSIVDDNYKDFFSHSLTERKLFNYPPFTEMLILEYRHTSKDKAQNFIIQLNNKLGLEKKSPKIDIQMAPNYQKKYNKYYYKIIIKWPALRSFLECIKHEIMRNKNLVIIFDS